MSEVSVESHRSGASLREPAEPWGSNILLVEDNPGDARLVTHMLSRTPGDYHVHHVRRLEEAVDALQTQEFSVVLLDLSLPDGAGPATVKEVSGAAPSAPIVVLTGYNEDQIAIEAIQAGAQDFLTKGGIDIHGLLRSMRFAIERKRSETRLTYLAHHDQLTGLANRACLFDRLGRSLGRAERSGGSVAVLFLDLDRFKQINDTLGHDVGDQLLVQVAQRLRGTVRNFETVARLGGDEFVLVLEGITSPEGAEVVAKRVIEAMSPPFSLGATDRKVSTSVGVALSEIGDTPEGLLERADEAMYRAKRAGRDTYAVWTEIERARQDLGFDDVERALAMQELELLYQPKLELGAFTVAGAEALLRWKHPAKGEIEPAELLPLLTSTGLMVPVGDWVLRQACAQARRWVEGSRFRLAVNVAPQQLEQEGLVSAVADVLEETRFPGQHLEIEVAASVLLENAGQSAEVLGLLQDLGVRIAIDDVDANVNLAEMAKLPLDVIKLDRSLVVGATECPGHAAIVSAVVGMARRLGAETVAEGIETARELTALRKLGCDSMQGFQLARPMSAAAFTVWLASREADC